MSEVLLLCPKLQPGEGGLIDYCRLVVEEWNGHPPARIVFPEKENFSAQLPGEGGKVFLQYSAYGFDPIGYPRWLLRGLIDWKKTTPAATLAVMFHEIWTFWPLLNKNRLVQEFHRADLRRLAAVADAIFTSTPSQAEHLRRLARGREVQLLPVGSNIRRVGTDAPRAAGVAILFGLPHGRVRALRAMQSELATLAAARILTKVIAIGPLNPASESETEKRLLTELSLAEGFEQRGVLAETQLSQLLLGATYGISAQDPLSVTKSGTFMAYAAHELRILSPYGDPAGEEPLCWLTQPEELLRGLSASELETRAQNLRAWEQRTADWSVIAQRFAEAFAGPRA